jgi:hypothetical protein
METNETIARWADKEIVESPHSPNEYPAWNVAISSGAKQGQIIIGRSSFGDDMVLIANQGAEDGFRYWSPDTDISLWHGDGGILQKIEEKGIWAQFLNAWIDASGWRENWEHGLCQGVAWAFRRAEAPQLAAALVKCIEGET